MNHPILLPEHIKRVGFKGINKAFILQSDPINSDLSNQSSETLVFSRKIGNLILVPYVFSLVFALMSRNKEIFCLGFPDHLIKQSCGSSFRFPFRVSVDVHCGTYVSVSKQFLHILWSLHHWRADYW